MRFTNYVLLALGLAMTVYAVYMFAEFEQQAAFTSAPTASPTSSPTASPTPGTLSPTPSPTAITLPPTSSAAPSAEPEPEPTTTSPSRRPTHSRAPTTVESDDASGSAFPLGARMEKDDMTDMHLPGGGFTIHSKLWFVYGFGAAGVATTLTALTGVAAAAWESRCVLHCHAYQLFVLMMGQAALAIALFTQTGAPPCLPSLAAASPHI